MWRQGDVLIIEATLDKRLAKAAPNKVLVYGEATGHSHRVQGDADVLDTPTGKIIEARAPFRVVHEEHATIEIPEGAYRVIRQREYDEEQIRYVAD